MKKRELLKIMDDVLLEKMFGFCYARTSDSYEAQELCSDILFALVKTANTAGDIRDVYPFIWRTARNVYADFCKKRKKNAAIFYQDDPSDVLSCAMAEEDDDDSEELLKRVYQRISFLTRAYREVNNQARIIMVTAEDRQEVIDGCKSLGALDCIMKPFGMDQILQALHAALDGENEISPDANTLKN